MSEKSALILKDFFQNLDDTVREITIYFHPDDDDGMFEVDTKGNGDFDDDIWLPELAALAADKNFDQFDMARFDSAKQHLMMTLKQLEKNGGLPQRQLHIYVQHIDKSRELILKI